MAPTIHFPCVGVLVARRRKSFRERLAQFDGLLHADVPLARQALRRIIAGRIEFRPTDRGDERGYRLRWSLVTSALIDGYIGVVSPRGFEPLLLAVKGRSRLIAWPE